MNTTGAIAILVAAILGFVVLPEVLGRVSETAPAGCQRIEWRMPDAMPMQLGSHLAIMRDDCPRGWTGEPLDQLRQD